MALAQTNPGFIDGAPLCANYPNPVCQGQLPTNPLSLNQAFMNKADVGAIGGVSTFTVPDTFCVVDRTGVADMGGCINQAIAAAKHCGTPGQAIVRLTAGTYRITTPLVPLSCVNIQGDGRGRTVLLTNNPTPFIQQTGVQLIHFTLQGVTFKESGSFPGATAVTFKQGHQASILRNIGFHGYTTGTLISDWANGTVTTFDDTSGLFHSSNSFFNLFEDIIGDDTVANGIYLSGMATTPCDLTTVTNVNTLNVFKDIQIWGATRVGWNIARFADSNQFIGVNIIALAGTGAAVNDPQASFKNIAVQMGDDNAACVAVTPSGKATNNDAVIERIMFTTSLLSPATSAIMINFGNATYGNVFDFQSDIDPTTGMPGGTGITAQPNNAGNNYQINGRNWNSNWDDGQGNLFSLEYDVGKYHVYSDGTKLRPALTFNGDPDNGIYHPPGVSQIVAFSHMARADQGFIAAGTNLTGIAGTFILGNDSVAPGVGTCPTGVIGGATVQGCWRIWAGTTQRVIPFF